MMKYLKPFMFVAALFMLTACWGEQKTGPEDIHWDRDTCELCNMFISEPRFAAEVRGGEKNKIYKFDDIGCALHWLNDQHWAGDSATEIWVADSTSSTRDKVIWLKAADARYVRGELTPMDYGYRAVAPMSSASGEAVGIDFVALTTQILAGKPNHICTTAGQND